MPKIIGNTTKLSPPENSFLNIINSSPSTENWHVFPSFPLNNYYNKPNGTDIDFLILAPQLGVFICEIKGNFKIVNGIWHFKYNQNTDYTIDEDPIERAKNQRFAFFRFLKDRFGKKSEYTKILIEHFLILPICNFEIELPFQDSNNRVIDKNEIDHVDILKIFQTRIKNLKEEKEKNTKYNNTSVVPTKTQCDLIRKTIFPESTSDYFLKDLTINTHIKIEDYTNEQKKLIDAVSNNKKIVFDGMASCGKTIMAQSLCMNYFNKGKSILYIVPTNILKDQSNERLSIDVDKSLSGLGFNVITLPDVSVLFEDKKFTTNEAKYLKSLIDEGTFKPFDLLIIDEFQHYFQKDDEIEIFDFCDKMVKGGIENGNIILSGEVIGQQLKPEIFALKADDIYEYLDEYNFTKLFLKINCRNPKKIVDFLEKKTTISYPKIKHDDESPNVKELNYEKIEHARNGLVNEIKKLLNGGIQSSDIKVLFDSNVHLMQEESGIINKNNENIRFISSNLPRVGSYDREETLKLLKGEKIEYNKETKKNIERINCYTIHQFRGCDSKWIIIFEYGNIKQNALNIAITRSTAGLIYIKPSGNMYSGLSMNKSLHHILRN